MIPKTDENTEEARSLQAADGRHGRTETNEIRVWWEVVIAGIVWNTRNESHAKEQAKKASEMGIEYELRRVEAVSRTETVTKVEVLSPIVVVSDAAAKPK